MFIHEIQYGKCDVLDTEDDRNFFKLRQGNTTGTIALEQGSLRLAPDRQEQQDGRMPNT
jgi:hypothetical protein